MKNQNYLLYFPFLLRKYEIVKKKFGVVVVVVVVQYRRSYWPKQTYKQASLGSLITNKAPTITKTRVFFVCLSVKRRPEQVWLTYLPVLRPWRHANGDVVGQRTLLPIFSNLNEHLAIFASWNKYFLSCKRWRKRTKQCCQRWRSR
jgi:hypothetical protein